MNTEPAELTRLRTQRDALWNALFQLVKHHEHNVHHDAPGLLGAVEHAQKLLVECTDPQPAPAFEILRCGDPYNKNGWDVREYPDGNLDASIYVFRGDLSPNQGQKNAILRLRKLYPGCKIRVTR